MEVICLQDEALYRLVDEILLRMKKKEVKQEDRWISPSEAMDKLRIKSKTTLQKLRDEGRIRFSQPDKRVILYDLASINEYLDKHSKDTF